MLIPDKGNIFNWLGKAIKGEWNYRNNIDYFAADCQFSRDLSVQELINMIKRFTI